MTAQHLPGDESFFAEWRDRRPGTRRSLDRARAVGAALGTWEDTPPVLTVVGSKGKGTAAIHAAAALSAATAPAGRAARVGLVSSPGLRTNRERVRIDGQAISPEGYERLAAALADARGAVGSPAGGYLSPTGAFTIAGAAWTAWQGAEVLVLEEGLGGRSDEVSLFDPRVVAVTSVFYEHGDLLGPTLEDVARDLLGVVGPATRTIVTVEQDAVVTAVLEEVAARFGCRLLTVETPSSSAAPTDLPPFTRLNATTGVTAARVMAKALGWTLDADRLADALSRVYVPGRMSRHTWDDIPVMVDGAISPEGVAAAVAEYRRSVGPLTTVVASFPDTKSVAECFAELRGADTVIAARADEYLSFSTAGSLHGHVLDARSAMAHGRDAARATGTGLLALGTQSFVGIALDVLEVETDVAYRPVLR
ncbi:hypothetical protein ACFQBY_02710 [Promicromonospora citrea]|uniref:Dihydrofolate synthase/folylpolyglutamate synthase n=1 Tax=Promicromonospora citrea TaxID=43677 RepID=A0A8H9L4V9_9MICO|nr:hypothetical protein [Promicromonospora citrea]NNH51618.1 hypothetical protein [Promicromonospora citrea]GGM22459.1 hypothetical protein GCM10010102_17690 [Promicromonospora citrea]